MSKYSLPTLPGIHDNGSENDCLCPDCMKIRVAYCVKQDKYNGISGFQCVPMYDKYPGMTRQRNREAKGRAEKEQQSTKK